MIAKVCDHKSRRDSWFENHLVHTHVLIIMNVLITSRACVSVSFAQDCRIMCTHLNLSAHEVIELLIYNYIITVASNAFGILPTITYMSMLHSISIIPHSHIQVAHH